MEKDKKTPVVYAPEHMSRLRYWAEKIIAFLLTLLVWFFLLRYIYDQLFAPEFVSTTTDMMIFLAEAIVVVFVVAALWQFYNWARFHGKDRRKEFPEQPLDEVGELYGISGKDMGDLQQIQRVAVVLYEDNRYYYCVEEQPPIEIVALRETGKGKSAQVVGNIRKKAK